MRRLLERDVELRLTAEEAMAHAFVRDCESFETLARGAIGDVATKRASQRE